MRFAPTQTTTTRSFRFPALVIAIALLFGNFSSGRVARAYVGLALPDAPVPHAMLVQQADGVEVNWNGADMTHAAPSLQIQEPQLPLVQINGLRLPAQLIAVVLEDGFKAIEPRVAQLVTTPWAKAIEPMPKIVPVLLHDDGTREERPDLASPVQTAPRLPNTPLVALREGMLRGHHIVVFAFSPIFEQQGQPVLATQLRATLPNARAVSNAMIASIMQQPFVNASAINTNNIDNTNTNANTDQTRKLIVTKRGMQRITGSMLASAGVSLADVNAANLHMRFKGQDVALEWRGMADGRFDAQDELRFYAAEPGDRWNSTDVYWLTLVGSAADAPEANPHMAITQSAPTNAPVRTTATERGMWRHNTIYDSTLKGVDGDYWFAQMMSAIPGSSSFFTLALPTALPLAGGPMLVTLLGSTYSNGQRTLSVQTDVASTKTPNTEGNSDLGSITSASFEGVGDWSHVFMLAGNAPTLTIGLNAATTNQYLIDGLMYERPVALTFAGPSVGFWSVAGTWAYQLKNVPTLATLYDVTDPLHPVVRPLVAGRFEDGPTPHAFWLSNPADEAQPSIEAPSATSSLDTLLPDLDEVYIVPRTLRDELTPLLALRYAQKHKASAVAIEDIYNAFSYGQIAPDAIRTFLRSTAKQHLSLKAVTLVGDGSDDPRNYLGKANPTLVPPFLADVDPWVHETACDVCYVQLDGDDALSDWLPDLAIGRLPVKNADELTALVNKMIAYETAPTGAWNWRSLHISDNYLDAAGNSDGAGNFPIYEETAVEQQPLGVDVQRLYYTPNLLITQTKPWEEPDALKAHARVVALFNAGAAVANFQGHGNVDRLAITDDTRGSPINYLLGKSDVLSLTNGHRLPVLIEMACLTSAFQHPQDNAATIDEMLVLAPHGGAIATWGATGLGVAYQHDFLQTGFYESLWATPHIDATLGDVTQQGLVRLFTDAACCYDALRTYVLLGDPMTKVRAFVPQRVLLPVAMKPD